MNLKAADLTGLEGNSYFQIFYIKATKINTFILTFDQKSVGMELLLVTTGNYTQNCSSFHLDGAFQHLLTLYATPLQFHYFD